MTTNSFRHVLVFGLTLAAAFSFSTAQVRANVFASNIKINGSLDSATAGQGQSVTISYILNEPASAGVTIEILSGSMPVRTITIAAGNPGTTRGLNTVVWDGKDAGGVNVPLGSYSVSIEASATGYADWTLTSDEGNEGNYFWSARGVAVNNNPTNAYYGRVFIGNAFGNTAGTREGDKLGIHKRNADGSFADEGPFSTGGVTWKGGGYSPWKIEVSDDGYVYANDWDSYGIIYRFDQMISASSKLQVTTTNNWDMFVTNNFSGPAIWGTGTNTEIWVADTRYNNGYGIAKFSVTNYPWLAPDQWVVETNVLATQVIPQGFPMGLYPYDVALDKNKRVYIIQTRWGNAGDYSARVMCIAADDPYGFIWYRGDAATDTIVAGPDWSQANGVAVNPEATLVAVAFRGQDQNSGNTKVFDATTGALVTTLDIGAQTDRDVAWDGAGNLHVVDNWSERWRVWSPPGVNSSTTEPPVVLTVTAALSPIQIGSVSLAGSVFTINFTAGSGDAASAFEVLSAASIDGSFTVATGQSVTGSSGTFQATVTVGSAPQQFYKIHRK